MKDYKKTKNDTDFTDFMKVLYSSLISRYGGRLVITRFFEYLRVSIDQTEWDLLDGGRTIQDPFFMSHLIDLAIDFKNNLAVDFNKLADEILDLNQFSASELNLLGINFSERLWTIFLAIENPKIKQLLN